LELIFCSDAKETFVFQLHRLNTFKLSPFYLFRFRIEGEIGKHKQKYQDIHYNAEDNVTSLEYTTPSLPSPHATITAANYDSKPNPYASIPFWKFMMNAAWDNYDPQPVLTALSKNNPSDTHSESIQGR
jgi:hypothetical protein